MRMGSSKRCYKLKQLTMEKFLAPIHSSKGGEAKASINKVLKGSLKTRLTKYKLPKQYWQGNMLTGKKPVLSGPAIYTQNYTSECFKITRADPCAAGFDIVLDSGYFVNLPLRNPTIIETDIEMIPNFARSYELRTNRKLLVRGFEVRPGVIDSNFSGKLKIIIEQYKRLSNDGH